MRMIKLLIKMAKRIVTKIGDVFCVEIDNQCKRYFQYIVNDMEQLNSSVIRVFKLHYPIDYKPIIDDIVKDEVEFYAHTILKFGVLYDAWYKVGTSKEFGDFSKVLFRSSADAGNGEMISERWNVWHINEPHVYVGKLTKEYQHAERGGVMSYTSILDRLKYGDYMSKYPGY